MALLTLAQVDSVFASHSMASVRSWLSYRGTPLSKATARPDFAAAVHAVIQKEGISLGELNEGMIDIEEASGKRINLFRVDVSPKDIATMCKQILSVIGQFSQKRSPAPRNPATSRRVYFLEDTTTLRAKWSETHILYTSDLDTLTLVPAKETKIVVLVLDKRTGIVQIRCDRPGTKHPHGTGKRSTAKEFYSYFQELAENLLGVSLSPVELRPSLERVVNLVPRVVECRSTELSTDDNYTFKVTPKVRGKDVRDSKDVGAMGSHGSKVKVREIEDLTWSPQQSNKKISRQVKTHVDGRESFGYFEADYHEGEVDYVLDRLL